MCKIDKAKFGTAIVLAGGKSSRMGFDKQFLTINKVRLLEELVSRLETEFSEIIIVSNKPEDYVGSKHKIVSDIIANKGPLSGLHVGLKNSSSDYAYFIACDMPNINLEYIKYMKQRMRGSKALACVSRLGKYIEVFNGFYSKALYSYIEESLREDKRAVQNLLNSVETLYIEEDQVKKYNIDFDMFVNLNTQDELAKFVNDRQNKIRNKK